MNNRTFTTSTWVMFFFLWGAILALLFIDASQQAKIEQLQRIQATMIDFQEQQYTINLANWEELKQLRRLHAEN